MSWAGPEKDPLDSVSAWAQVVPVWARSGPGGRLRTQGPLGAVLGVQKVTSQPGSGPSLWSLFPLGYDLTSSCLPGRWVGPKRMREVPFIVAAATFEGHYSCVVCGLSQFIPSARKAALSR